MNILWIYDHLFKPESGGTERVTKLIMDGLTKRGHNCMALLIFDQKKYGNLYFNEIKINDLYNFLTENNINIVINQIAYAKWLLDDFYRLGGERWRNEGGRVISCLHFDPKFPSISIKNLFIDWNSKTTYAKAKRLVRVSLTPWYNWKAKRFYRNSYQFIYDNSDAFILLSSFHLPSFLKISQIKDQDKIHVIFNPLTFSNISPIDCISKKEKIILVVSRLCEEQKRLSYILKAWKKICSLNEAKEWKLVIIGEGENESYYKNMVVRWKLERVVFEGQQNPEPFYHKSSIMLMTSSAEGWGLTITESLQRGVVPIVMESSSVFREIIKDGITGFIVPNNSIKELSARILKLINKDELRVSMAENALKDANRFTLNRVLNLWENIFSLLNTSIK